MTYIANSLTSANPAADLYTAMAAALTSAGFTLSDTQVISTRTHKVWKSAAANNSQGLDWYLDVAYTTTGAGSVWLGAFEGYSTPNGIRGPYNNPADGTVPDATTFSRYGATGSALETNWTHISGNLGQIQVTTSAFAYFISITTDRVIAMTSVAPLNVAYCGFFDTYAPWANKCGAALYPLVTCVVSSPAASVHCGAYLSGGNSTYPAGLTRRPPVAAAGSNANFGGYGTTGVFSAYNDGGTSGVSSGGGISGPLVPVDTGASSFFDTPRGGRLQICNTWPNTSGGGPSNSAFGLAIGLLKDVAAFASSAVTRGDTIAISGTTWVLGNTTSNRCYGFKAA